MKKISLSHGSGGLETFQLIKELFIKAFSNPILEQMEDSGIFSFDNQKKIAFTIDGFTVSPLFFPGGDIGKLSIVGTANDLTVSGAKAKYMAVSFYIEEGLDYEILEKIVQSMKKTAEEAGILIITGDTKVVPKGSVDKIFITTAGIGEVIYPKPLGAKQLEVGDIIIVSGPIGEHGACIFSLREGMEFEGIKSDCANIFPLFTALLEEKVNIKAMRDPTRGGLSAVLNEWAFQREITIEVEEETIPISNPVKGLCEFLGIEPYELASEGRLVVAVSPEDASKALEALRKTPLGKEAAIIGRVIGKKEPKVILKTSLGVKRILEPPKGEILPRIC
jgi:hydrogenase expression/formation protein HypE